MKSEAQIRQERIDVQLGKAGWTVGSRCLVEELLMSNGSGGGEAANEFADYALLNRLRIPIAIVEAKKSSRSPLEGERQASDYADRLLAKTGVEPFIFLANGNEVWFWNRRLGPPRRVSGFFSSEDLERLAFQSQHREMLNDGLIDSKIINRAYQEQAVKTVSERIAKGHRRFLLVMATGTGKTRTAVALVDLLQRYKWVQRVLFLADRRELVKQSLDAFKEHLPDIPRARIESGDIKTGARIYGATYPSMMASFRRLSPGFFDLIIADESHRSIYNRYRDILDHFDAIQLGLTATPTDFIDHNTFQLFNCEDGLPTFYYGYEEAVNDHHLVPYRPIHVAKTRFQIEGVEPGKLPAEFRRQLNEQGITDDELTFEGTDLERKVTNTGTTDALVREFMDVSIKDAVGTLPAKTIIFAMSHRHALEIYQGFNRLYPDLQRSGLAKVIDSHMERVEKTFDDFKNKDFPRVAISVDMLDTGVDIPAIRNLVFAKPVFSYVKFWQMIGRGTRLWTDPVSGERKRDFLIIDHWDSFAYFQVNKEGRSAPGASEPLPTSLFRRRLEKLQILTGRNDAAHVEATRSMLQSMLSAIPGDNINVAPHVDDLQRLASDASAWQTLDDITVTHLSRTIAPLLRFTTISGWATLQFENLIEELALAHLKADAEEITSLRDRVMDQLSRLPTELPEIAVHAEQLAWVQSSGFWDHLDYGRIMELQRTFAPLMRFRQRRESTDIVRLTLTDEIAQRHWIVFGPAGEGAFVEAYRNQVEGLIWELAEENPALRKVKEGQDLSPEELESVSSLLNRPDLFVSEERLREAYEQPRASLAEFLRHILKVAKLPSREEQISQAFDEWVRNHPRLNATQLMFVRTLRQAVLSHARILTIEELRQPPFNRIGEPTRLFSENELAELIELATSLAA